MGSIRGEDTVSPQYAKIRQDEEIAQNKFKMFFAGLIFAILSYIGTNSQTPSNMILKIIVIISMISLLISGMILLAQLSNLHYAPNKDKKLSECIISILNFYHREILSQSKYVWIFFMVGMMSSIIVWSFKIITS